MASLSLKNITKIYPHSGDDAKKAKKAKKGEEPEKKKVNLKVTEEGVIAVQEFNLEIADKEEEDDRGWDGWMASLTQWT